MELTIKKSIKAYFTDSGLLRRFWKLSKYFAIIGLVVGVVLCFVAFKQVVPWWKYPLVVVSYTAGGFAIIWVVLLLFLIMFSPFVLLPVAIHPAEMRFLKERDRFLITKNGRTWLEGKASETNYQFVILNVYGLSGNPRGDQLRFTYMVKNRIRMKVIPLAYFSDADVYSLRGFMARAFSGKYSEDLSAEMQQRADEIEQAEISQLDMKGIKRKVIIRIVEGALLMVLGSALFVFLIMNDAQSISASDNRKVKGLALSLPLLGIIIPFQYFSKVQSAHKGTPEVLSLIRRTRWLWAFCCAFILIVTIILSVRYFR